MLRSVFKSMLYKYASSIFAFLCLSACAGYHPMPITSDNIAKNMQAPKLNDVMQQVLALDQSRLKPIALDFNKPLTPDELAVIAVVTNPDLKALRASEKVSQAQVFNAGLLPDPVFSPSIDYTLQNSGQNVNAYTLGLSFDIGSFFTRGLNVQAAQQKEAQAHYDVAWQEWLVANQAHLLALQLNYLNVQLRFAKESQKLSAEVLSLNTENLRAHNIDLATWDGSQTAYFDAEDQENMLAKTRIQDLLALKALLGFPPNAKLNLARTEVHLPAKLNTEALFKLAKNSRLDLLALQAGYANQETQVRQAILGQYPHFSLDVTRARDNTDVNSLGPGLSFDIPLWNRNRGNIAIAKATRAELYQEYMARLAQTRSDIATIVANLNVVEHEYQLLQHSEVSMANLPRLSRAFHQGNLSLSAYTDLASSMLLKQQKLYALQQNMAEQCVALQIAVGRTLKAAQC